MIQKLNAHDIVTGSSVDTVNNTVAQNQTEEVWITRMNEVKTVLNRESLAV